MPFSTYTFLRAGGWVVLCLACGLPLTAWGQGFATESFSGGAPPAALEGYPSGSLATETWNVQNNDTTAYLVTTAAPLLYPNLSSTPAYASGGGAYLFSSLRLDDAWNGAFAQGSTVDFLAPNNQIGYNGSTSETLWISMLLRNDLAGNAGFRLGITSGIVNYDFGLTGDASGTWGLRVDGTLYPSGVPVVVGEPVLAVLAMTFVDDSTTTFDLYLNPGSLGGMAPDSADVSHTHTGAYTFRYLTFYPGQAAGQGALDEIRFGTSYAEVTPLGNFTLDISATNGTVTASPSQAFYALGDTVTLTAQPGLGYIFDSWSGAVSSATNPLTVVMDSSLSITAHFVPGPAPPAYVPALFELVPQHQLLLPVHLLLGDSSLFSQTLSFAFTSSDPSVVSNPVPIYQAGNQTLIVAFEGGKAGTATLSVVVSDGGSPVANAQFDVSIASQVRPDNRGIRYTATDVAHWQPRPYKVNAIAKPGYPVVLEESYIRWRISESSGQAETDANYFFHGIMSGILIPAVDGDYTFEIFGPGDTEGNQTLWLAEGLDFSIFPNETNPLNPTNFTAYLDSPGTVTLTAGTPYYFEAHHRQIINDWVVDLQWRTPDDNTLRRLTQAEVVRYVDMELPTAPGGLAATMGETVGLLSWDASSDNDAVAGYHVFVNGARVNDSLLTGTQYYLDGLTGSAYYELAVVAVDAFGNHSFPSDLLPVITAAPSPTPPATPLNFTADLVTAFKAELSWAPVPDAFGYRLYQDGQPLHPDPLVDTVLVVRGLAPETAYTFTLEAVNVSLVPSTTPASLNVTTLAFDVNNPNEDLYLAETALQLEPLVKATGLMINFSQSTSSALIRQDPPAFDSLMQELKPAGFRFGAITANSISFLEATGPSAAFVTYGEYAQATLDAGGKYLALTLGPGSDEDYYNTPATVLRLMEYLAGDASTIGGARRVAEGYQAPFADQFDQILIELGNEVWGGNAHDVAIGTNYPGLYLPWAEQVKDLIVSSPYYDPDKYMVVVSARSPQFPAFQNTIFNASALDQDFPYALGLSGYVGGNIMDAGEDYGSLVNNRLAYHKESYNVMSRYLTNINQINTAAEQITGRRWPLFPYESNSTQNTYHGSLGQALLIVDYLQEYVKRGGVIPALFHLSGGQWRMITQNADGSYTKRPLFEVAKFFNQATRDGVLLRSSTTSIRQLVTPGGTPYNMIPVGVHAFNRGDEYAVMCFSRDYEHDFLWRLDLPDTLGAVTQGRIYTLTGSNFDAEAVTVTVDTVDITDGMLVPVPRYSLVMVAFQGTDFGFEAPLFPQPEGTDAIGGLAEPGDLLIYPSPVRDAQATLRLRGFAGERVHLSLSDATGRQLHRWTTQVAAAEAQLTLPTAGLPAGLYLLTVQSPRGRHSLRFVVH